MFNDIKASEKYIYTVYTDELEEPLSAVESALLGKACATCQGYCCSEGGTHGFQDYPSLEQYLSAQPAAITVDDLAETYSSYIPSHSYQDACIFQSEHGCTLPRDMRSFTCNNYRCGSLTTYQQAVAESNNKLTYAAAVDLDTIFRTHIFNTEDFVRYR